MKDLLLLIRKQEAFYRTLFRSWPHYGKLLMTVGLTMLIWGLCQYFTSKMLMQQLGLHEAFRAPEGSVLGAGLFQAMWILVCWFGLSLAVALGASFNARPFETTGYALGVTLPVALLLLLIQGVVISGLPQISPEEMQSILNQQNGAVLGKLVIHAEDLYVHHPLIGVAQILMLGSMLWQGWVIHQALAAAETAPVRRMVFCGLLVVIYGLIQYNFSPHWHVLQQGILKTIIHPETQPATPDGGTGL